SACAALILRLRNIHRGPAIIRAGGRNATLCCRPAPENRRARAMWFYRAIQTCRTTTPIRRGGRLARQRHAAGLAMAVLALLALETPRAQPGFQAPLNFDAGADPVFVAVADFDRDGIADLAVANGTRNTLSVLLGKGDGSFRSAVDYPAGDLPVSLAVGDFNRDGFPDLVVANNLVSGTVSVLLGNGDGSF